MQNLDRLHGQIKTYLYRLVTVTLSNAFRKCVIEFHFCMYFLATFWQGITYFSLRRREGGGHWFIDSAYSVDRKGAGYDFEIEAEAKHACKQGEVR